MKNAVNLADVAVKFREALKLANIRSNIVPYGQHL